MKRWLINLCLQATENVRACNHQTQRTPKSKTKIGIARKVVFSFVFLILSIQPAPLFAQSISVNKEVLQRGDVLVVSSSGPTTDNTLTCSLFIRGMSTGCNGEYPITDELIDLERPVTPVALVMWDYAKSKDISGRPPADSDSIVAAKYFYILNDMPAPPENAIEISKQHLKSGEEFTVRSLINDHAGLPIYFDIYRLAGRTLDGLPVLPERLHFENHEKIDDSSLHFTATAPIYPGSYEIRLRTLGDYIVGSVIVEVDLALPEIFFEAEESYSVEYNNFFEINPFVDAGALATTAGNSEDWYKAETRLERQLRDGSWVETGAVRGTILAESGFWRDGLEGTLEVRADVSGRHRLTAIGHMFHSNMAFEIGSVEFDVILTTTDPDRGALFEEFSEPAAYNTLNIYRYAEQITVTFPEGFDRFDKLEVEIHLRDFGNRKVERGNRFYRPESEPQKTWILGGSGDLDLPIDLDPGDYEFHWRGWVTYNEVLELRSSWSTVFTVLPPAEQFSVSVDNGEVVPFGAAIDLELGLPELLKAGDPWLFLEIHSVAGTYFGDHPSAAELVWQSPALTGETAVRVNNTGQGAHSIYRSGLYEVRYVFGRTNHHRAVVATQRFWVSHQSLPGALSIVDGPPNNEEPFTYLVAFPGKYISTYGLDDDGWSQYTIETWRKGDVLPSGIQRFEVEVDHEVLQGSTKVAIDIIRAGHYEARLVQMPHCMMGLCPHIVIDRLEFEVADNKWIGPAVYAPGESGLTNLARGPQYFEFEPVVLTAETPETDRIYQPPPFIAFEAAIYPSHPRPGERMSIGMRFENESRYRAASVVVDITLADPRYEGPPESLEYMGDLCTSIGAGTFRCAFGDMDPGEIADVGFSADTPMSGILIWTADLFSAGDLGGITELSGVLGQRAPPHIVEVVVLHDQTRVEDSVPLHPYPFGPNTKGSQSRYLLVVGHNLPQHNAAKITVSDDDTIDYGFLAYPDTENEFYQNWIGKGWRLFYETEDETLARARAKADGYDAILINAGLLRGIVPGRQTVVLADHRDIEISGYWDLEFGDIEAQMSFVRLRQDGGIDQLSQAYLPERIHLAIQINMPLPVDEIPVLIDTENLDGTPKKIPMIARRSELSDGTLYLTGPIDLHHQGRPVSLTGGNSVAVLPDKDSPPLIQARVDTGFIFRSFRLPIDPFTASASVSISPASGDRSWLWNDALARAALCHEEIVVEDWNALSISESEDIWNLMVFDSSDHFPNQSVSFGHHAAAILLRDLFELEMQNRVRTLQWVRGNEKALESMIEALKPIAWREGVSLLRMEVSDFDGGDLPYRYVIMNSVDWLADRNSTTKEAIVEWQMRQTVAAIDAMLEAVAETLEFSHEAGDCEVEDLILLTGRNFDNVAERLKANLMTLSEVVTPTGNRTQLWQPDNSARFWVDQVAPLAAAVQAQQRASQTDTSIILAVSAVITMPVGAFGSATLQTLVFIFEIADLGYSIYDAYSQIEASDDEIAFASGASLVIGNERYQSALEDAQTWIGQGLGVAVSAFGVVTGAYENLPKLVVLRRVARGRQVVRSLVSASEVLNLKQADLQDFSAFAMRSRSKSVTDGVEALTHLEKRAIALVDELREINAARSVVPAPELVRSVVPDDFTPTSPLRFDVVSEASGVNSATVHPPASGRIEAPVSAGDVPNALEVRVPPEANVRFKTEGAEGKISLPLGRRLGIGATSEVFAHAEFPQNRAIRITYVDEKSPAAIADRFGDLVLRTEIQSEHIRPVEIFKDYPVTGGSFGGNGISRVSEVEQLDGIAWDRIKGQEGGQLTIAQIMAFDGALNDLNAKGYVWLDNKGNNFDFVPLNDGSGRVQVVVMDPGGIYRIRLGAGASYGITDAQLAWQVQLRVNGEFTSQLPDYAFVKNPIFRTALRQETLTEDFGDVFDFEVMELAGQKHLRFNPRSGEDWAEVAPIFEANN